MKPRMKDQEETPPLKKRCSNYFKSFNSLYQSLLLALVILAYLLIGAVIFEALERPDEIARLENTKISRINLRDNIVNDLALQFNISRNVSEAFVANLSNSLIELCPYVVDQPAPQWEFRQAIFFATTVITTIGYGTIAPQTSGGRSFCCIYALIGIPLTVIFLGVVGQLLVQPFEACVKKLKGRTVVKIVAVVSVACAGFVLFFIIPAIIFMVIEEWTYRDALYFVFVSLSTIGFGDFTPGSNPDRPTSDSLRSLYRVCVSVWIFIGLAFLAVVLTEVGSIMTKCWKRTSRKCRVCCKCAESMEVDSSKKEDDGFSEDKL